MFASPSQNPACAHQILSMAGCGTLRKIL